MIAIIFMTVLFMYTSSLTVWLLPEILLEYDEDDMDI